MTGKQMISVLPLLVPPVLANLPHRSTPGSVKHKKKSVIHNSKSSIFTPLRKWKKMCRPKCKPTMILKQEDNEQN